MESTNKKVEMETVPGDIFDKFLNRLQEDCLKALHNKDQSSEIIELNDDEANRRVEFGQMFVSLWRHASSADGVIDPDEEFNVSNIIHGFFSDDGLFPPDYFSHDQVFDDLISAFLAPHPYDQVVNYAKDRPGLLPIFFAEACIIVASDSHYQLQEHKFLEQLGKDLNLNDQTQQEIRNRYLHFFDN